MFDFHSVTLPDYSRKEDIINSITHAVGVPISTIGAAMLIYVRLSQGAHGMEVFAGWLYLISMDIVFLGSAIYHGLRPSYAKQVARVIDHCNVLIVIAGSNIALFLAEVYKFNSTLAVAASVTVAAVSAVGIFLTLADQEKFKWPQYIMYLVLGGSGIVAFHTLWETGEAAKSYVLAIIAGLGIMTVGAALYLVGKKKRYFHAVFHVLMLAGMVVQIIGSYNYLK